MTHRYNNVKTEITIVIPELSFIIVEENNEEVSDASTVLLLRVLFQTRCLLVDLSNKPSSNRRGFPFQEGNNDKIGITGLTLF
jgi:hypothetical protein